MRWDLCLRTCADLGVTAAIELAPAGTLTGIAKRELPGVELLAIKTPPTRPAAAHGPSRSTAGAPSTSGRRHAGQGRLRPRRRRRRGRRSPAAPPGHVRANRDEHEIVAPAGARRVAARDGDIVAAGLPIAASNDRTGRAMIARGPPAPGSSASGHYRPANVVTNHDLIARGVDTDDEWIKTRVGIAERRWADPDETVVDMAEAAASKALANSGVAAADIDFVLVATCTMTEPVPAAAPQLAARLGIDAPGAYDINSGCSGFVYALARPSAAIRTGQARNVLVVASERFSGWLDLNDRSTCIILGDGAGAAVVGPSDEPGIGPIVWGSDGAQHDTVAIDAETPVTSGRRARRSTAGRPSQMAPVALEACRRAGVDPSELAAFVPHQANLRIIEAIAKRLGATERGHREDIVTSGNTSAATHPAGAVAHGRARRDPVRRARCCCSASAPAWPTPRQVVLAP